MRQDHDVAEAVIVSLLNEQGEIDAYTGQRIKRSSCHIEHVRAQIHCKHGEDVDYNNMVACYPAPNSPRMPYGAHKKGSWPSREEEAQFVSPLRNGCEERFTFHVRGEIRAADENDTAAKTTIERLHLDHDELNALRKGAVQGTLNPRRRPTAQEMRKLLRILDGQQSGRRRPFCFVIKQVLRKYIRRSEAIQKSKRRK